MLSHPDEIELMRAGWSAIPAGEISAAIRECLNADCVALRSVGGAS